MWTLNDWSYLDIIILPVFVFVVFITTFVVMATTFYALDKINNNRISREESMIEFIWNALKWVFMRKG